MGQMHDLDEFRRRQATLGMTRRELEATRAEKYYLGEQYENLGEWDDVTKPLRERKPRIIVPLYKEAIDSIARFTWGGHRFPPPVVPATVDKDGKQTSEIGPHLDKDQAAIVTKFLIATAKAAHLKRVMKELTRKALQTTSGAIVIVVRDGYISARVEEGKHCKPEFDSKRPGRLNRLEVKYQFPKDVEVKPGIWEERLFWYRRVIDKQRDVCYVEVPVIPGREPNWQEDPEKTINHGFNMVPARWFRTLPDSSDEIDGTPVIDPQLYALLDDINYTVSQRSRSIKYVTDPQIVRKGVREQDRAALNKAPGLPWDLPVEGSVELVELKGSGAVAATEHAKDLTEQFRAAVSYVKANPETTSGNISGVVLEFLHAPMISLAADLRDDLGSDGYCGLLALILELLCRVYITGEIVYIPGFNEACETMIAAQGQGEWMDPQIDLEWAPFFAETALDKQAKITYTQTAKDAGLVAPKTAIAHVATIFNVADAEAEQDEIDDARTDEAEKKLEEQQNTAEMQAQVANKFPPKAPPGAKAGPTKGTK